MVFGLFGDREGQHSVNMIAVSSQIMLCWMVGRKVDGSIDMCGFMVDTKLEGMVESVYCKVQVCNNIVKFSGGGKV
jgi:hypothetical protein